MGLSVAKRDQKVMSKILNMTECADKVTFDADAGANGQTQLMQCTNVHTGKTYEKVRINSASLRRQFAGMKHPKVIGLLRAAGINVDNDAHLDAGFVQTSKKMD